MLFRLKIYSGISQITSIRDLKIQLRESFMSSSTLCLGGLVGISRAWSAPECYETRAILQEVTSQILKLSKLH